MKAGRDHVDQQRSEQHAKQHHRGCNQHEEGEDGGGGAGGLFVALFGIEAGVDGDERCREDPFAKEVLQHVGDAEGGLEGVGSHGVAEVVGEDALTDEADDLGKHDAGGDGERGRAAVVRLRFGQIG